MIARAWRIAAGLSLALAAPTSAQEWVGPRLHSPSREWVEPIVPRRLDISAAPTDPAQWVALYTPKDFSRLRTLSRADCATAPCAVRTVWTLSTAADVASFKKLVIETGQHPVLEFVLNTTLGAISPPSQLLDIAGRFTDMLLKLNPDVTGEQQHADFETVLARGGEVRYAERLEGTGPYRLVRSLHYIVAVGQEIREFPLWTAAYRAEVAAPDAAEGRTLETQLEEALGDTVVADPGPADAPAPATPIVRTPAQCAAEWVPRFAGRWTVTPDRRSSSRGAAASTTYWAMTAQGYFDVVSASGEVLGSSRFQVVPDAAAPGGCVFDVAGRGVHHIERFADGTFTIRRGTEILLLKPR